MSGVWWGRESPAPAVPRPPRGTAAPILLPAGSAALLADFDARTPNFTPEWTNRRPGEDAGMALRQLFGEQLEAVVSRLDRWPAKAFIEFLNVAGLELLASVPAEVLLQFDIDESAPQSVLIAPGFQVGANPPGAAGLVLFETTDAFYAAPGKIAELFMVDGRTARALDASQPFAPFGDGRSPTAQFFIGLSGTAAPSQSLNIGIGIASPPGAPPPVPAGGISPLPVPPGPALAWEIFDGGDIVPVDVVSDETGGLVRSGIVTLTLPRQWRPATPAGLKAAKSQRWLRLRVAYGRFNNAPQLSFLALNVARALGAQTIRNEVPEAVPSGKSNELQLSQTPVVAGSLVLQVDDGGLQLGPTANGQPETGVSTIWSEVADLSLYGPDDAVYRLDAVAGRISFGDGMHGKALPPGYRNVRALSYQVQSDVSAPIEAGKVTTAVTSLEFLSKVSNPQPVTGGGEAETLVEVQKRGPQEIRARGRAVMVADYALLATRAKGADIRRAFAVAGLHPQYPGRAIPGVVGVFVVPPDRGEGQPTPDPETLRAVAASLAASAAPAGIEVVATAPNYQQVSISVGIILKPGADAGATVTAVLDTLNRYFHPLTGGDAQDGWPFGGTIRYVPLLRRVAAIAGVSAVPRLNVLLDGIRQPACTDVSILPYSLLWPSQHQVLLLEEGGAA